MNKDQLSTILKPYNPWWGAKPDWLHDLPDFERPIVKKIISDLRELRQVISVTGPRRVGKTTAVRQVIINLIRNKIDPKRIIYFSFDDPALFSIAGLQHTIFDLLVDHYSSKNQEVFFFLDEIQRLPRWELFIKKYFDLNTPIRFVVSGSASSPIFRSSQESLLGRIKDHHLLPFSFREYCQYKLRYEPEFHQRLEEHKDVRPILFDGDGRGAADRIQSLDQSLTRFKKQIAESVSSYCQEGGFPEVWGLSDPVRKIEYLMEQQVRKVLYEDLMLLTQYRKPENVLRFFVYLLANPGIEINAANVSNKTGIERRVIDENLPRLEMTDLIIRIRKFSHQPLRVRQGNFKCYPIDMALRNAVLRTWEAPNSLTIGYLAENMVLRELIAWPEKIEVAYFKEKKEIDFIFTHGGNKHLPFEVKQRDKHIQVAVLKTFIKRYGLKLGIVITREQKCTWEEVLFLPLRYFLLACNPE